MLSSEIDLSRLTPTEGSYLLELLNQYDERLRYNKLDFWFPDTGPFARRFYPKHIAFLNAGNAIRERAFFGGNRVGKSETCAYELACHATGRYPWWWEGRRFDCPISAVCLGKSHQNVRDVAQYKLLGNVNDLGSGMIPKDHLHKPFMKQGIPNGISQISVDHYDEDGVKDGVSVIDFMSYEQGYEIFQGVSRHFTWEDEESPDPKIHSELITRTATVDGLTVISFTPLEGLTETVLTFIPEGEFPPNNINIVKGVQRWVSRIGWSDVPHLSERAKKELLASYHEYEIEARTEGLPAIGAGKVFKIPEGDFVIPSFQIPNHWPRCYGFDFAFFGGFSACAWLAYDEENDTVYLTDVYKMSNREPALHASAILSRGSWIPGVIDPSAKRKMANGNEWIERYQELGLDITLANNSRDVGLMEMNNRLVDGRFKVFNHCMQWLQEYRLYRFNDKREIPKNLSDDLMDATRYGIMSGIDRAISMAEWDADQNHNDKLQKAFTEQSRDKVTGY